MKLLSSGDGENLVIWKFGKVGGDTDPESIIQVFAILKGCRTFEPEYAKDAIDRVTNFSVILRCRRRKIIKENILMYTHHTNEWNVRDKEFSELIMKIAGEIFVACAVSCVVDCDPTSRVFCL